MEANNNQRSGLTGITIENFKGIGDPVHVPLRPITLLFGANSAGKSTIIQALQYAWEVLANRNADVDRTRLGGEAIDLGGFRNLVHNHDLSRSISITLNYAGSLKHEAYMSPDVYFSSIHEEGLVYDQGPVDVTDWVDVQDLALRVTTAWNPEKNRAYISAYEVNFNGVMFGRIEGSPLMKPRLMINADHPYLSEDAVEGYDDYARTIMENIVNDFADPMTVLLRSFKTMTSAEQKTFIEDLEGRVQKQKADHSMPESQDPDAELAGMALDTVIPEWKRFLTIRKTTKAEDDTRQHLEEEVVWVLSQLLLGAGESILEALGGLRYLGPLRSVPDRGYTAPLHVQQARWANGLGAWDALLRSEPNSGLASKCSAYLSETLGLGYTMSKVDRIQLDTDSEILSELNLIAARYEEFESDDLRRRVLEPLSEVPRVPCVQLHDEKNDIDVDPMDIGVGVSQTLPVVVGAVDPNCSIFAVEQPELHVRYNRNLCTEEKSVSSW